MRIGVFAITLLTAVQSFAQPGAERPSYTYVTRSLLAKRWSNIAREKKPADWRALSPQYSFSESWTPLRNVKFTRSTLVRDNTSGKVKAEILLQRDGRVRLVTLDRTTYFSAWKDAAQSFFKAEGQKTAQ